VSEDKPKELIILLDLNYTLVGNSKAIKNVRPFEEKIRQEQYREWLVDLIKDYYTILITARPDYQKEATVKSIEEKLPHWMPDEMYFQEENDRPPVAKEKLLKKYIFPVHGIDAPFLAIESNPRTKQMYSKYNISSVSAYHDHDKDGIIEKALIIKSA